MKVARSVLVFVCECVLASLPMNSRSVQSSRGAPKVNSSRIRPPPMKVLPLNIESWWCEVLLLLLLRIRKGNFHSVYRSNWKRERKWMIDWVRVNGEKVIKEDDKWVKRKKWIKKPKQQQRQWGSRGKDFVSMPRLSCWAFSSSPRSICNPRIVKVSTTTLTLLFIFILQLFAN